MSKVLTFEEAVRAALDGKELQFKTRDLWHNSVLNGRTEELIVQLANMRDYQWRIKPDAFEELFEEWHKIIPPFTHQKSVARYFWNKAMEHKNNE